MTEQLLRRVAALEEATNSTSALRVVIAEIGETAQAALLRQGFDPDAGQQVLAVVFG
jgi:hypothetical protein